MTRLFCMHSIALVFVAFAAILATPSAVGVSTVVHAYRRRAVDVEVPDTVRDYLSELTVQDLRLMLARRGVEPAEDASRAYLQHALRGLDAEELRKAAEKTTYTQPVTVKVLYCVGSGHGDAFEEFARLLRRSFGDFVVLQEDEYPAPPLRQLLAGILQVGAYGSIFVLLFAKSRLPAPAQQWVTNNRVLCFAGVFVAHSLSGMLLQTGAFEVFVDGQLAFSALASRRAPQVHELVKLVEQQLRVANRQQ
jgi:selT/selW/selH-like putative selenoprotein